MGTHGLSFEVLKFERGIRHGSDHFQRLLMSLKSVKTIGLLKDSPVLRNQSSRANEFEQSTKLVGLG